MLKKSAKLLPTIGLILVVIGVFLPITGLDANYRVAGAAFKWIYSAGAIICLIGRLLTPANPTLPLRVRRLMRLESWSAIFFCVGAFFLFYNGGSMRDWLAFTLAGATLLAITSIAIPRAQRKAK